MDRIEEEARMNGESLFDSDRLGHCIEIYLNDKSKLGINCNKKYAQIKWNNKLYTNFFTRPIQNADNAYYFSEEGTISSGYNMTFDTVIINECLEFVPDIITFLCNVLGYLKDDGGIVFINRDRRYSDTCIMPPSTFMQAYSIWKGDEMIFKQILYEVMFHLTYKYDKPSYWNAYPISDRQYYPIELIEEMHSKTSNVYKWFIPYWRFDMREFLFFIQGMIETNILCVDFVKLIPTSQYEDSFELELKKKAGGYRNHQQKTSVLDELRDAANALYREVILEENDIVDYYVNELRAWKEEFFRLKSLYNDEISNNR